MLTYLIKGGPVMVPIVICSVAAGACALVQWYHLWQASRKKTKPLAEIKKSIEKRDWNQAYKLCTNCAHPFLRPWSVAFSLLTDGKSDLRDIEQAVEVEAAYLVDWLESPLRPLSALTSVLTMLGFLGTITGLIMSFQTWEQMGTQVSISALAGGIYQAMITTAAGLIAAIPYLLLHHYFMARTSRLTLELSHETTELFRFIKEALLREVPLGSDSFLNSVS